MAAGKLSSQYQSTYTTFAGTDIVASVTLPGVGAVVLGSIQTISYSTHRDKFPARTLGRISPKGYSYGGRTIAGSIIFTVFNRNTLHDIMNGILSYKKSDKITLLSASEQLQYEEMYYRMLSDELPPFDINISLMNEYGQASKLDLLGVMIVDEGQVMSIEDIVTENTMSFIARDIVPMMPIGYTTMEENIEGTDKTRTFFDTVNLRYPWG